jgi:hypothetical protein
MQQIEQQPGGYLKFNVGATAAASAVTALIIAILALPLHLMRERAVVGFAGAGRVFPGPGREFPPAGMPHPMGGGFALGLLLVWLLIVLVYAGVAGALFAAIYNVTLTRR